MMLWPFKTIALEVESIVWAENASKARYATLRAARSAGYDLTFSEIKVSRAHEYDGMPTRNPGDCIDPKILDAHAAT